jgi:hypothetical protein
MAADPTNLKQMCPSESLASAFFQFPHPFLVFIFVVLQIVVAVFPDNFFLPLYSTTQRGKEDENRYDKKERGHESENIIFIARNLIIGLRT